MKSSDAPLMLSVSGVRGIVGRTMTPAVAADFAAAFGTFVKRSMGKKSPLLCIGRDSRPSGAALSCAAVGGLASVGCRVIDLGIVATPTVAVMIGKHRAAGGMAITASHNPIQWNGLKCLNSDGVAPPPELAKEIVRLFNEREIEFAPADHATSIEHDSSGHETHIARVLAAIDPKPIRRAKFKIVLDSVNGAGCVAGRMLLESLGCKIIHLNGEPTGLFAHQPEPTETNLTDLAKATKRAKAACGFAQDPDADRLAIIDNAGRYIGEEYTLVLAALRMLEIRSKSRNSRQTVIATNLSTSRMIDDLAAGFRNVKVIRTAVGEANVVSGMKQHKNAAMIGGEGNGGVILPRVCWVRDSLSAMALTLSLLAARRASLSEIVDDLPRYSMIKHKFDLQSIGGASDVRGALRRVMDRFRDANISTVDGVRIDFADGWVHLRPSNTEPIVRLIAEAKSNSRAWELIDETAVAAGLK
jgi:phosphomannomutase